eukprot:CAMPEP_0115591512 /NCGR_PEP_ID=MMETSP0272-20121206/10315_1 /TAXON_ID=71861 /ORGANISM="Scrippsiella trochoidea, Strain CCMP3099" /LENGTH=184 /DNA_ID=CAMNT_0003026735 /DNA_START=612 /DNA_END=1166 /DNA_ORIENTATION=-
MALGYVQRPQVEATGNEPAELLIRHRNNPCEAQTREIASLDTRVAEQAAVHNLQSLQAWTRRQEGPHDLVRTTSQAQHVQVRIWQGVPISRLPSSSVLFRDHAEPPYPEPLQQASHLVCIDLELEDETAPCAWWQLEILEKCSELRHTPKQALKVLETRVTADPAIQHLDLIRLRWLSHRYHRS